MGQKVNPYGFRLGVTTDWKSRWFTDRDYQDYLIEDWKIRDYLMSQLERAAVSRIEIERTRDRLRIDVHTARPGHRDRPAGRRGRPPAHQAGRDDQEPQGPAQHPGDQAARAGRRPDGPGHRRPAGRPGQLPAGHEADRPDRPEGGGPRHPGPVRRPPRRLGDVAAGVLPGGPGAPAHPAGRHRLRLPRGQDHLRPHRRQGLDLQGQHPALQGLGRREDQPGGGHGGRRDFRPEPAPAGHLRGRRPAPPGPGRARLAARAGGGRRRPRPPADAADGRGAAHRGGRSRAGAPSRRGGGHRAPHPRRPSRDPPLPEGRLAVGRVSHVDAAQGQAPQGPARPADRPGQGRHPGDLRRLRDPGSRAGLDHAPARSRPPVSP